MSLAEWRTMQEELIGDLEQYADVQIMLNNGAGFDSYPAKAVVRGYNESDLVPGGSIQQGDIKLIIPENHYPNAINRPLERKDRITFNGKTCSVVHFDGNSRNIGGVTLAYEITVRG